VIADLLQPIVDRLDELAAGQRKISADVATLNAFVVGDEAGATQAELNALAQRVIDTRAMLGAIDPPVKQQQSTQE
jgi:hypothetical protein